MDCRSGEWQDDRRARCAMAIPRSRPATSARKRCGDRLVARDLEFCSRINRTKSPSCDRWRGLDDEEVVARIVDGIEKGRRGLSVAAEFGPRVSQHRTNARLVL